MNATGHKIRSLQLLRAVAVLLVVYAHLLRRQAETHFPAWESHFFSLQNFGAVGVDIFFVISGFIITIISQQYAEAGKKNEFLLKRLIRVIPVYWLVSFYLIARYFIINHKMLYGPSILKAFFFFPVFDKSIFDSPVLGAGWTLCFEILFYLVIAISMRINTKKYLPITIGFFLCSIIFSAFTNLNSSMVTFIGNPIILEFLLGITAGIIYLRVKQIRPLIALLLMLTGIGWLIITVFTRDPHISEAIYIVYGASSLLRVLVWGIPSALLVSGTVFLERSGHLRVQRVWIFIGDASYSIYLAHGLVLLALYVRWERWNLTGIISPDLLVFISLLLCTAAGCLFYRVVEKPVLRFCNRRFGIAGKR